MTTKKTPNEEFVDLYLEDNTFEDLLEYFDISTYDAFDVLFENGLIDEELLEAFISG